MAVLHNPSLYYETPVFYKSSELASINYDEHFVISSNKKSLNDINEYMMKNYISHHILDVSYAFHSEFID